MSASDSSGSWDRSDKVIQVYSNRQVKNHAKRILKCLYPQGLRTCDQVFEVLVFID